MGWVWTDDGGDVDFTLVGGRKLENSNPNVVSEDHCSIRKVVRSRCKTEEVTPGKIIRKCEKTEEIFRDCLGRPVEIIESTKESTEEDVTNKVNKGSFSTGSPESGSFDFPGLRSDIEAIERSFSGRFNRFFEAAEEIKNGFFHIVRDPYFFDGDPSSSSPSNGKKISFDDHSKKVSPKQKETNSGSIDLSGLARDV